MDNNTLIKAALLLDTPTLTNHNMLDLMLASLERFESITDPYNVQSKEFKWKRWLMQ